MIECLKFSKKKNKIICVFLHYNYTRCSTINYTLMYDFAQGYKTILGLIILLIAKYVKDYTWYEIDTITQAEILGIIVTVYGIICKIFRKA